MRIRLAVPDELDDQERKEALNAALEAVTIASAGQVRRGIVPPAAQVIKAGQVKWKPEPPGDEHFDLASTVVGRGWGDCDDLAPYYAGSLRATGTDPKARAFVKRSGPTRWHALVRRGDGTIEDPSRHAGMGHSVSGVDPGAAGAAIHHPMTQEPRLCIAIRSSPDRRHWQARVDVPDSKEPWSWTSLAHNGDPRQALINSMKAARTVVGEDIEPEDDYRLAVLNDLVLGADPYDVAQALYEMADDDVDVMRVVLDGVQSVGFLGSTVGNIFDTVTSPLRAAGHLLSPLAAGYDKISPWLTPLAPGLAHIVDPIRTAIETGDPMATWKSTLIPGARSGRDFFERNPLGKPALAVMKPIFGNIPGADKWFAAAAPRAAAAAAAAQHPAVREAAAQLDLPPGIDPMQVLAMLLGQNGNAPPTLTFERGAAGQSYDGGPAYMRF